MKKLEYYIFISLLFFPITLLAQTRIQTSTGNSGTNAVTSFNVTLTSTPATGNTLIALITTRSNSTNNVTGITQTGATWTRAISSTGNSTNNTTTEIWYTTVLSGASTAITINQGSARSAAVVMEYNGLVYGAPLDQTASNFNSTQNTTATTGTTSNTTSNDELWIAGIGLRSSSYSLSAVTNSFISVASSNSTNSSTTTNAKIYALEQIVVSTGTATSGGTVSTRSYWSGAVAAFRVAVLNNFSPISACKGSSQVVTINGEGFTSGSAVDFNGTNAATNFVSANQLTATLPANATPGFIHVTTSGSVLESKKPFLIKAPEVPTANVTNTTCPASTDGAVAPNNIPIAVNFDYTQAQYINLGTSLLNNLAAFTLEGWVKCTNYNRNSFFGQNNGVEIGLTSSGTVELWSEGLYTNVYSPNAFPTDGLWHHIAGTGDGTTMKIYLDGELIATKAHATLPSNKYGSSPDNTMIGGYVWDNVTPNYHNGQILKVGFWDTALSNTEIAALASTPHQYSSGEANLIAGYNFFEGTGTSLAKTPSGTNGTLTGTTVSTWTDLFTYSWTKVGNGFSGSTKNINNLSTGTYNLAATFNGCTSNSGDFVVNSNGTLSTASESISGLSRVCPNTEIELIIIGGSLGTSATWKWYAGACGTNEITTGITNGGRTLTITPSVTTTYYARAEGSCNTTACVSKTVTVNATGEWLGTTSTDWNTASNWCGGVPTSSSDVLIPTSPAGNRFPVVGSAGAVCKSVTIATGASVIMDGAYSFNVHGNFVNNGTFTPSTSTVTFMESGTVSGSATTTFHNLTIYTDKTLSGSSTTMNVTGNWTNNGTFTHNNGTIVFNGTTAQDINGVTTFNNLTVNNTAGVVAKNNVTVNGILNLASANASSTVGSLDLSPVYSSDVLTSSNNLYMGANATTTGIGDVTGRVIRTTITKETTLSFGNALNTIEFFNNVQDSMPSQIAFISRIGVRHSVKNNTVKRYYQIVKTGGGVNVKFNLKLHYLDSELDTITENRLVYWDHHVTYSGISPHEHGKTDHDLTNNWLALSGHAIGYLAREEYSGEQTYDPLHPENAGKQKIWILSGKQTTSENIWIGAHDTDWNEPSNWTAGTPTSTSKVLIILPANEKSPIIADGETKEVKSITINTGASLTAGVGSTLIVNGDLAVNNGTASWNNQGTFNPGTSTVNFTGADAAITGSTDFFNLTIASSKTLNMVSGSEINVSGTFTNSGTLNTDFNGPTIFVYSGASTQDIADADYYHLELTGSGAKTLPANASINISGDLDLSAPITATSNTIVFNGTSAQTLSGSSTSALNNVTLNNANGLTLSKNQTIDGTLTFTSGLITTDNNVLTLGCSASTSGEDNSKYVNGKLARNYCAEVSKLFPIGKGGEYRPLIITRTTGGTNSTTIQSEQFESTILGVLPSYSTAFADRFWTISQPSGAETYTIQIDGTGFVPAGTTVILKGNGTAENTLSRLTSTTPEYTTAIGVSTFGDFTLGSECLPPTINTHPAADATCEQSNTATFTVSPEAGSYTYTWEVNAGSGWTTISNGGVYSNATSATLTITTPPYSMNGYTYRANVTRTDCGSTATSNAATLTVTPKPQGSLSANSICKGEIGYLTWTATAGTGPFTVIYNDGTEHTQNNVISGTPFAVGAHIANKTYTLVSVTDAAGCTRTLDFTQASATVTVNPFITWTGATNTDWQIATNWCGGVPTTADNVLIPASPTNQPVISSTGTGFVHSIIIENGASVTVDGEYIFNISGNITNAGTISMGIGTLTIAPGTIVENVGLIETQNTSAQPLPVSSNYGNSGTIRFNGAATQTLFAGTYNDVVVDNPQGVIMAAAANVVANGTLEIKSGSRLEIGTGRSVNAKTVLNNGGTSGIVIKSENGQPSGTLIFNNSENAAIEATVEMYSKANWDLNQLVNAKYKWQFIGIPVQSMNVLPTFYGGYVRRYNESGKGAGLLETNRWIQLQNEDLMEALEGYEIVQPTAKKYEFPGMLYNQSIQKTLTYTVDADYPGQHLIGNPYTAAIDIGAIEFGVNTQAIVYLYNTGTFNSWSSLKSGTSIDSTSYTAGQYTAITKEGAGFNGLPRQIPSMQAFMVRTSGTAEGSVTVNYNAVKQKNFSVQRAKREQLSSMRINLIGEKMDHDVMWLFSQDGTTRGYDNGWDAPKLAGDAGTARIQTVEGTSNYQINTVPDINETIISARAGANDTSYKLKITNENMLSKYNSIYLLDLKTNALVDISQTVNEYNFTMTNTSSEPRFKILTSAGVTTGTENVNSNLNAVVVDNKLIICNNTSQNGTVSVYDINGIELLNQHYPKNTKSVVDLKLQKGVYLYKLTNNDGNTLSKKIILN